MCACRLREDGRCPVRQLALIEEMLELEVNDERYAQLLFRKAELLHERARYYTFSVGSTEDKAIELDQAGDKDGAAKERRKDYSVSDAVEARSTSGDWLVPADYSRLTRL